MAQVIAGSQNPVRVLVIGGTLFVGKELVRRALERGYTITVLHRGGHQPPAGVQEIICDRNDSEAVRLALRGRSFDLVFDNVYDWVRGTTAEHVRAAAEACGTQIRRYVFMSTVASYGLSCSDMLETAPLGLEDPFHYVRNKARAEQILFELHDRMGLPIVILRPAFIYGPHNPFYRETFFWDRIRRNRPLIIPDNGSRRMQLVYVKDLVWLALRTVEVDGAIGQAYNVAGSPITQLQLVRTLAAIAGREPRLVFLPRSRIKSAGGTLSGPHQYFGENYELFSITVRTDKVQHDLGFQSTPLQAGLTETYEWYLRQASSEPRDFTFEDHLISTSS